MLEIQCAISEENGSKSVLSEKSKVWKVGLAKGENVIIRPKMPSTTCEILDSARWIE